MKDVLTIILAGGKGTRLEPLTQDRSKPAVPFGGAYRIIDFTLSNCINSELRRILVLTQYKGASLGRHIDMGWNFLYRELNEFIEVVPPQQRIDENWYLGTADAVYQNIYMIERHQPKYVLILSGDHIYKMDYRKLVEQHVRAKAAATLACIPVELQYSREFGVIQVDKDWQVTNFIEKPAKTDPMPDDPDKFLASMGVYVFDARFLFELLCTDANNPDSAHDFGRNIIPSIIHKHRVQAYPFRDEKTGEPRYWRDVGTIDAFYEANIDMVAVKPELNLYDQTWPVHSYIPPCPPAKTVFMTTTGPQRRVGEVLGSAVCSGSIISGGCVRNSLLSYNVRVNSWAEVEDSILFDDVEIGRHAKVRRAIIDKHARIPEGARIGYDPAEDIANGYTVTESGIVVVPKSVPDPV